MSSVAFPRRAARRRASGRGLAGFIATHGYGIVLAAPIGVLAAMLLIQLPQAFNVDSWLGLVTGRVVWQTGIPQHEMLTAFAHGATWIDQQWLSQLIMYALFTLGGLALVGLVNVLVFLSGVIFATVAARRRGAPFLSTLIALPVCVMMITPSREVRTQEFAIPLFMLLAWLLASDSRHPSRRVFWCLPILALWANLHGTVTLGATLVGLHGVTSLWERRRDLRHDARAWLRPVALVVGAAAAILITPYGLSIIGYYHSTMVDSTLRNAVSEWRPIIHAAPTTAVTVFLVTLIGLWSFVRYRRQTTNWEKLAFVVVAVSAISVNRNALFLGLLALMILPVSAPIGSRGPQAGAATFRTVLNGTIAAVALCLVALGLAVLVTRPDSRIEHSFQRPGVLAAVQQAVRANPGVRVMPEEHFTDWLLWRDPSLAGRVAYDVRYELLAPTQIQGLNALFAHRGSDWKRAARGYRVLVLSRQYDPAALRSFRAEPGIRVLYNDGQRVVLLRSAAQAAKS